MMYYKRCATGWTTCRRACATRRTGSARRREGWPALHAELATLDPITAARLAPNDSQRIQRALEICRLSGQPMSALLLRAAQAGRGRQPVPDDQPGTPDRAALHARIEQRFDAMLAQGLIDEVRALRARGDLHPGLPSVRCVGYRQMWAHLDGEIDLAGAREQGIAATRQLAKRQITWLRAQPERVIVDCLARDAVARTIDAVAAALGERA